MDTNKKYFIDKFQRSHSNLEQAACWEQLSSQDLNFNDWKELSDSKKINIPTSYGLYAKIRKKAMSFLKGKDAFFIIIRLISCSDAKSYDEKDSVVPYYEGILGYELSTKELTDVFLGLVYSLDIFEKTNGADEIYEEMESRISNLILARNPTFDDLAELNYSGLFTTFQDIERRLEPYNIKIEEVVKDARIGILEENSDLIHEDRLVETITECSLSPTCDLYLKFKELANDEDAMDNLLSDARNIIIPRKRKRK